MDNRVSIRKAVPSDLEAIIAVENTSFGADRFSRRQFSYLISQAKGVFYVADSGIRVVGYISLLQRLGSASLRIYSIAVLPDARGMRTGQRLIDKAKDYARSMCLREISLEVRRDNAVAIKLYYKNGFRAVSVIKGYYSDGEDALHMRCLIG